MSTNSVKLFILSIFVLLVKTSVNAQGCYIKGQLIGLGFTELSIKPRVNEQRIIVDRFGYYQYQKDTINVIANKQGFFQFESLKAGKYVLSYNDWDSIIDVPEADTLELILYPQRFSLSYFDCFSWFGGVYISADAAVKDIKEHNINLYLSGPLASAIMPGDGWFRNLYKIGYIYDMYDDFYFIKPRTLAEEEVAKKRMVQYNKVVIKYLDKKFGKKWRKKARRDVVGLYE